MQATIQNYVRSSEQCARKNQPIPDLKSPLIPLPVPNGAFNAIQMDVAGPFVKSVEGYLYVLVVIDTFTSWVEYIPMKTITAIQVARALYDHIYCRFGSPMTIQSDRGTNFISTVVQHLMKMLKTTQILSSSYSSQTNGRIERQIRTLVSMLSKFVGNDAASWPLYLPSCRYAYNTSVQSSTQIQPSLLVFGRELRTTFDNNIIIPKHHNKTVQAHLEEVISKVSSLEKAVKINLELSKKYMKSYFDRRSLESALKIGDLCWLYLPVVPANFSRKYFTLKNYNFVFEHM